ncbi:MAG: hypothetical protein AB9M53_06930 [Leptothrix sp. (in: b-proteobacteria)]
MWLITPIGFFSIVQKPGDAEAGTLTVRARVRADLEALRSQFLPELGGITESRNTDYRFRASAPREAVALAAANQVRQLDYSNFKSEVARQQGHARAARYHDVWATLLPLQTH